MRYPKLNQFRKPEELMIIKHLAYLKKKETETRLTPQEKDMLYGTVHHNELCQILYNSECLRPWFTDRFTFNLNLFAYVAELVIREGDGITSDMLVEAVFVLLEEAYSKLLEPVNGIYTGLISSYCGNVIKCYDFTKPMNILMLDRIRLGYSVMVAYALKCGINEKEIIDDIESKVRDYYISDDADWLNICENTNYQIIDDFVKNISEMMFMQLKKQNNY